MKGGSLYSARFFRARFTILSLRFSSEIARVAPLAPRSDWAVLKEIPVNRQQPSAAVTETGEFLKNGFYVEP